MADVDVDVSNLQLDSLGPALDDPSLDLPTKIRQQVEFYLSDGNLARDKFLLKHLIADVSGEGFLPISLLASFPRMKKLTKDLTEVRDALKNSETLIVSNDGGSVRRKAPFFPGDEDLTTKRDPILRKLYVSSIPKELPKEALTELFGRFGKVRKIDLPKDAKGEVKGVAFVEYYTKEDADNALDHFPKDLGIVVGPFSENSAKRDKERRDGMSTSSDTSDVSDDDRDRSKRRSGQLGPNGTISPENKKENRKSTEVRSEKRLSVEVDKKANRQSASKLDLEKNAERREKRLSANVSMDKKEKRLSGQQHTMDDKRDKRLSGSSKDFDRGSNSNKRLSANKADLERSESDDQTDDSRKKRNSSNFGKDSQMRRKTSQPPYPDWEPDPSNSGDRPKLTFLHKTGAEPTSCLVSPVRQPLGPPSNGERGFGRGRGKPL